MFFFTSFEVNKPQYGQVIIFVVLHILSYLSDYVQVLRKIRINGGMVRF